MQRCVYQGKNDNLSKDLKHDHGRYCKKTQLKYVFLWKSQQMELFLFQLEADVWKVCVCAVRQRQGQVF